MIEPVARVFVHKTGGNVGIRWSGVPVDGAPLMHDGELLYTADAIREAVLAEREACLSACNKIATESKNYHAQGGAQACWYAIKARGGEA